MLDPVSWETQSGTPVQVDDLTITTQAQALTIQTPFGGFVWNRPSAVSVEENGRIDQHPIPDVTRMALITFFVMTLVFNLLMFLIRKIR